MAASSPAVAASKASIREAAVEFAKRYEDATSEQSERQTFWNDFFAIFGLKRRQVATFERIAKRASTGNHGWIDLLFPGQMGVEHKSAGEDLDEAMQQLVDYLPSLTTAEHPWLLVACDFQTFRWENLENDSEGEFRLDELPDKLDVFYWLAGYGKPHRTFENDEEANLEATALMAELHDRLSESGYPDHALREWLTRILFFMFADDTGVWERAAFHAYIAEQTALDGSDLGAKIAYLFQIVNQAPNDRPSNLSDELNEFTYVNGDLFAEQLPIATCDKEVREALLRASTFDWGAISPAIFGSMFQNVMTPVERRQLGAHYTTEQNILRTIQPLFLDELREELERADTKPKLEAFLTRLAGLTFFDPACGCGNFLVIAYREIRKLETEGLRRLRDKQQRTGQLEVDITLRCRVRVDQFYGIEIEEFPAKIARTALYLMDHLANREVSTEFGQHFVRFPIPASPHIEIGNALRMDWSKLLPADEADYVFGNPPFVGHSLTTDDQQADNRYVFGRVEAKADGLRTGRLDYVACWYARAYEYVGTRPIRCAFVSTNSVTQGEQARSLGPLKKRHGFEVDFAHRTFAWTSEARGKAHVHVVIIGFSHEGQAKTKRLWAYPDLKADGLESTPKRINWYLNEGADTYPQKRKTPLIVGLPTATKGSQPTDGGHLIVEPDQHDEVAEDPIASQYLRPFLQGSNMLSGERRWCLWLVDAKPADLRSSPVLRTRLSAVAEARRKSATKSVRDAAATPALFTQRRQPLSRYLAMPEVSSERRAYVPMMFLTPDVIAGNKLIHLDGAPVWLFGFLQSAMFMAWLRTIGGRLKSDISISPDLTYCTFPFPTLPPAQRDQVEKAAQLVLDARAAHPDASLADLYDPVATPADLVAAHGQLDRTVDRVMAPRRRFGGDDDRVAVLLDLYAKAVAAEQLPGTE